MEAAIFCFSMLQKYINAKQKDSEIKPYALCLVNVSRDFAMDNM